MTNLFEELKRRKVFRVAAVYAVVSWVVIQIADTLFPALQLPGWTVTFITVLLILGFFPTMVSAWAYERTPEGIKPDNQVQASPGSPATSAQPVNYIILAVVLLVAIFQVTDRFLFTPPTNTDVSARVVGGPDSSRPTRRFEINLGVTVPRSGARLNADIALSRDGRRLAVALQRPGTQQQIYIHELDQVQPVHLPGADGGDYPSFSPDGEWIVFNGENTLQKISVRGGAAIMLADNMWGGTGAYWSAQDQIYYSELEQGVARLMQINSNGGIPTRIEINRIDNDLRTTWPHLLSDKKSVLYTSSPVEFVSEGSINLLNLEDGSTRTLIQRGYNAHYVPSGHIVFIRDETLWAVPFDLQILEVTGPEVPVVQGVHTSGYAGAATYSFSDDGLLVYLPGGDTEDLMDESRTLHWIDREGNQQTLPLARYFARPRLSPDGQRLAVTIPYGNSADVWVYDLARNTLGRLTFNAARDGGAIWSADGERIIYRSNRGEAGGWGIWWKSADGTGQSEPLVTGLSERPLSLEMSPDGTKLIYENDSDLYELTVSGDEEPRPLIAGEGLQVEAAISPDGRSIAYMSDETGEFHIYVRPFPDIDAGRWQISSQESFIPQWNGTGEELFFASLNRGSQEQPVAMWSVEAETGSEFLFGEPNVLFSGDYLMSADSGFDVSPDGSRFILMRDTRQEAATGETSLVAVENWFAELNRLAPPIER